MQNKKKTLLAVALLAVASAAMAGCGSTGGNSSSSAHVHNYTAWDHDETGHWKYCEEDGARGEEEAHSFVDGTCECGYEEPGPAVQYGSASGFISIEKKGEVITDYSDVEVSIDSAAVEVTLDKQTGEVKLEKLVAGKDYTLSITKPNYITVEMDVCVDADEHVTLGGTSGIKLVYELTDMKYFIANAAGHTAHLYVGEELIESKVVDSNNEVTFEDVDHKKSYQMSLTVMGRELPKKEVEVNAEGQANIDFNEYFNAGIIPSVIHIDTDTSAGGMHNYSFKNLNIDGNFGIAAKFQVTRKENSDMSKEIRLGFQIKFGGVSRQQTLLIEGGKWRIQQMETWKGRDLPTKYAQALEGDGLIIAYSRNASTGRIAMFYGTSIDDLELDPAGVWFNLPDELEKQKDTLTDIGFAAWNEAKDGKGAFDATITPLLLGDSVAEAISKTDPIEISVADSEFGSVAHVSGTKIFEDVVFSVTPEENCILKSIKVNEVEMVDKVADGQLVLPFNAETSLNVAAEFEKIEYGSFDSRVILHKYGQEDSVMEEGTTLTLKNEALGEHAFTVANGKISGRIPAGTYEVEEEEFFGKVTVAKGESTSDIILNYKLFYNGGKVDMGWGPVIDLSRQNDGIITHPVGAENNAAYAISTGSYFDVAVKAFAFASGAQRQGVLLKFGNDVLSLQLEITPTLHKVSWMGGQYGNYAPMVTNWAGMPGYSADEWTQDMTDKIAEGTFSVGLVRHDAEVLVTINDVVVSSYALSSKYAEEACQIGVWSQACDTTVEYSQRFAFSEDVSAYGITGRRFTGASSVTETGNDVTVNVASKENLTLTQKAYGDISAEFTVHPYAVLDNGHNNRNGFVLRFEDNKVLRYDFQYKDGNAQHDFQRVGWDAIDGLGWGGICQYDMTKYETEGIRVKITRQGTTVKVYLDGVLVQTETLNEKYAANKVLFGFDSYDVTTYDNVIVSDSVAE